MDIQYREGLNRGRFETWTEKPEMDFLSVKQVHGTDIVGPETLPADADGLMVSWEEFNRPLAIKTADCMPIVIEGETGVVFLHAGWRGLANGILKKPEVSLIKPQRVFIGPSIHECCFEVSADFKENFPDSPFFKKNAHKYFFDLQQEARRQFRELFPNLLIEIAPVCTSCRKDFHSWRRDKNQNRNWNLYIKG
ncbi:MAG: polyphenol oxidase family protein [Bacteriovoracaceae bacterium]